MSPASRVVARGNIVEGAGVSVKEGIEESEDRLPGAQELIVDKSNDGCKDRRGARSSANALSAAVNDDLDVLANGRNIRVSTAADIELARVR